MSINSQVESLIHVLPLLPEARVGKVSHVEPIAMGMSGASVYAVRSSLGELVLRVHAASGDAADWAQQLLILHRASAHGVAPAIIYVDDDRRAVVSTRVPGVPFAAQRTLDPVEHETFASLRQIAALLCGTVFISLVPDLRVLPERASTLGEVYAAMRTGKLDMQSPSGCGAFGMALLRLGLDGRS